MTSFADWWRIYSQLRGLFQAVHFRARSPPSFLLVYHSVVTAVALFKYRFHYWVSIPSPWSTATAPTPAQLGETSLHWPIKKSRWLRAHDLAGFYSGRVCEVSSPAWPSLGTRKGCERQGGSKPRPPPSGGPNRTKHQKKIKTLRGLEPTSTCVMDAKPKHRKMQKRQTSRDVRSPPCYLSLSGGATARPMAFASLS